MYLKIRPLLRLLSAAMTGARAAGLRTILFKEDWYWHVSLDEMASHEKPVSAPIGSLVDDIEELPKPLTGEYLISCVDLARLSNFFLFLSSDRAVVGLGEKPILEVSLDLLERLGNLYLRNTIFVGLEELETTLEEHWVIDPEQAFDFYDGPSLDRISLAVLLDEIERFLAGDRQDWRRASYLLGRALDVMNWTLSQPLELAVCWSMGLPLEDVPIPVYDEADGGSAAGPAKLLQLEISLLSQFFLKALAFAEESVGSSVTLVADRCWQAERNLFCDEQLEKPFGRGSLRQVWENILGAGGSSGIPDQRTAGNLERILLFLGGCLTGAAEGGNAAERSSVLIDLRVLRTAGKRFFAWAERCGLGSMEPPLAVYHYFDSRDTFSWQDDPTPLSLPLARAQRAALEVVSGSRAVVAEDFVLLCALLAALDHSLFFIREATFAWYNITRWENARLE